MNGRENLLNCCYIILLGFLVELLLKILIQSYSAIQDKAVS